ncbi:MAG: hypothetical protein ABJ308_10195 [Halieaceae bacterium]
MSSKTELLSQQKHWALAQGLEPDERGYLADVALNLFQPMSGQTKSSFEQGSGSELLDTPSRPAKMKALHSSSALAVNFFDLWVSRDASPLQRALNLDGEILKIEFESQYPTGLGGNPPNLDVALELSEEYVIGVESKYTEWLSAKPKGKEPFKPSYFPSGTGLWEERGLPESQELARRMRQGEAGFRYLDAPQLLKHSLGLANQLGKQFSLYYVYLDWPGKESAIHSEEIGQFGDQVGKELGFVAMTYQELLSALNKQPGVDAMYLSYLGSRYCSNAT